MSEYRPSISQTEFLELIDKKIDPGARKEFNAIAEQVDADHKKIRQAVNWLTKYGDHPATDMAVQLEYERDCEAVAAKLAHDDPDQTESIIERYEERAFSIGATDG